MICGRRGLAALAAVVCVAAAAVVPASAGAQQEPGFSDLRDASEVFWEALESLAAEGVMDGTGCGDGRLCPNEAIARSEIAVWLVRVLDGGDPPTADATRFDDIDDSVWWAPHTERLYDLEVTFGCATDPLRYCPDTSVTRAQTASFLARAFDLPQAPPAGFADTARSVHETHIDAIYATGITVGCATDPLRYCPNDSVTRAQMAAFLHRATNHQQTTPTNNGTGESPDGPDNGNAGTTPPTGTATSTPTGPTTPIGPSSPRPAPAGTAEYKAVAVSQHICAIRASDKIECWGRNFPEAHPPQGTFTAVAATLGHSCGIRTDGNIACWGFKTRGWIDAPRDEDVTFKTVSAGEQHFCAIRADDDTIVCWGSNTGRADAPQGAFKAVSGGGLYNCAIRADNDTIACWKEHSFEPPDAPQGPFKAVAAGHAHTCALRANGTIVCWGSNLLGGRCQWVFGVLARCGCGVGSGAVVWRGVPGLVGSVLGGGRALRGSAEGPSVRCRAQPEHAEARDVGGCGQQVEVGVDFGPAAHTGVAAAVFSAHEVR